MDKTHVSIKDIASMAGVSIATVSRVLNKTGRYTKETEERVNAVMKATNYHPNLVARGLRVNRMNNIGIITPDITNEFFAKLVMELQTELFAAGYCSLICNTNENPDMERRHFSMLQSQNVAGIIYMAGSGTFESMTSKGAPTAYIDRVPDFALPENSVIVESDNFSGGMLATSLLLSKGCKDILLLSDKRRLSSQQNRINGYHESHSRAGAVVNTKLIRDLDSVSFGAAYSALGEAISLGIKFDGIFASTDWLAMGAYQAAKEHGLRIPEDVKLVGYDGISAALYNEKPITTICQNTLEIARATVEAVISFIQGKEIAEQRIKVPVALAERETT
ncbi:MAG: LacI family transcriptional regulator [Clostridiales bacterium]|nr:LacI family transcriptional regulator [Clostridiales bacterium]MDR2752608.1 LacI family transcriptional regulator [Clostridiales bacterium]